jgi:hypothetical protein
MVRQSTAGQHRAPTFRDGCQPPRLSLERSTPGTRDVGAVCSAATGDPLSSARKRRWHRLPNAEGAAGFVIVGAAPACPLGPARLQPINKGRGSVWNQISTEQQVLSPAIDTNAGITAVIVGISIRPHSVVVGVLACWYSLPQSAACSYRTTASRSGCPVDARRYDCRRLLLIIITFLLRTVWSPFRSHSLRYAPWSRAKAAKCAQGDSRAVTAGTAKQASLVKSGKSPVRQNKEPTFAGSSTHQGIRRRGSHHGGQVVR